MMRTRMQPVQKLAEPHSVASNGANAINDAHIINHDEEHGADLAPTDDLYGVLRRYCQIELVTDRMVQ